MLTQRDVLLLADRDTLNLEASQYANKAYQMHYIAPFFHLCQDCMGNHCKDMFPQPYVFLALWVHLGLLTPFQFLLFFRGLFQYARLH